MATVSSESLNHARTMGTRAGQAMHDHGLPSRNPFTGIDELERAWASAYIAAAHPPRR